MHLFLASWILIGFLMFFVGIWTLIRSDQETVTGLEWFVLFLLLIGGWASFIGIVVLSRRFKVNVGYEDGREKR